MVERTDERRHQPRALRQGGSSKWMGRPEGRSRPSCSLAGPRRWRRRVSLSLDCRHQGTALATGEPAGRAGRVGRACIGWLTAPDSRRWRTRQRQSQAHRRRESVQSMVDAMGGRGSACSAARPPPPGVGRPAITADGDRPTRQTGQGQSERQRRREQLPRLRLLLGQRHHPRQDPIARCKRSP
jgi:hypothetical protein